MDDITIFLILGVCGALLTIILCITGKKESNKDSESTPAVITVFGFTISVLIFIYIFRLIMISLAGILSEYYVPTIVGGVCGLIPLLFIVFVLFKKNKSLDGER